MFPSLNFPRICALSALAVTVPLLGGCAFVPEPAPAPTPTPAPTPSGVQFDPSEGSTRGAKLNALNSAKLPDAFRIAQVVSGQEVVLQPIDTAPGAVPLTVSSPVTTPAPTAVSRAPIPKTGAVPAAKTGIAPIAAPTLAPGQVLGLADPLNPVRLAGIVVPTGTQTGAAESAATLNSYTIGQNLDVDLDPVFPTDTDNKRRVQIFYKERAGKYQGQLFSLNRMMVRSGFAVVDLYSPTSFDQQQWLYDETFAREHDLGLWKTNTFRVLQQRVKLRSQGTGAKSTVRLTLPKPGDMPASTSTTTTTTTTSNSSESSTSTSTNSTSSNSTGG